MPGDMNQTDKGRLNEQLTQAAFEDFPAIFRRFRALSEQYGGMSMGSLISAFSTAMGGRWGRNDPYIQNRRAKAISSLPRDWTKNDVARFISAPDANELPLRQVEHALEYTSYPMFHMRKVYQDLLSYHNYIAPAYLEREPDKAFWREWRLLERVRRDLDPKKCAHEIVGQAIQEGKVFYHPQVMVDKSHNQCLHAFLQQLPSDWCKIVGLNNKSKYTVAFNLMYFAQMGTDWRQFGDLFQPYLSTLYQVMDPPPKSVGKKVVFARREGIDLGRLKGLAGQEDLAGAPEAYYQNGRWFYWVILPPEKVFTFEIDDVSRNAVSPFTGLFLDMLQLAQLEAIQLELVQNPLVSLVTGEIPYSTEKDATSRDTYLLSNAGMQLFQALWYQMMEQNNTNGIGLYMAPLKNLSLHQLSEAPSAMDIVQKGYSDAMSKAGLSAILPVSDDPRAGVAQISLQIESRFAQMVYSQFERMMQVLFEGMGLNYEWQFRMFGSIATDKETLENARSAMTLGILPAALVYNAMQGWSLLDDLAVSRAIQSSGVMDLRLPLVSTYSAKQSEAGLPPQAKHDENPGGRPSSEGIAETDGQEADLDSLGG